MDGYVTIGTELDTKSFDAQISELEDKLDTLTQEYETALKDADFPEDELIKYRSEIEKTTNKIIKLREKQDDLSKSSLVEMPNIINNIGSGIEGITKKVAKWGLAIFGIRSAYSMIRQAISTLSQEDDQIATDIEYMRWILAQTLKPIVEWIIKALYFIIALVNSIFGSLFNINLLTGKSADAFKNMKKSTGGISKDLAQARKQLAGFDEMNVLQDNASSGGGIGSLENWTPPDLGDYTKQVDNLTNEWEKFGKEMEWYLSGNFLDNIMKWINAFGIWGISIRGVTQMILGLHKIIDGIIGIVKGVIDVVVGLVTGNTEQLNKGIQEILDGLKNYINGLINLIFGRIQLLVGAIIGIVGTLAKYIFNFIAETINDAIKLVNNGLEKGKTFFMGFVNFIKGILQWVLSLFGDFGTKIGQVVGVGFKIVINAVLSTLESMLNTPIKAINSLIKTINKIPGINITTLQTFKFPRLAKGGIINMPGKGVPVGSALAGERGQEGVIPLTDSQQMDLLGEAIGKHITINATIPVYAYNRQVDKQIKTIKAEDDFAFNR